MINTAVELARMDFRKSTTYRALDLACGPGNLTMELHSALNINFPGFPVHNKGLDFSEINIALLNERYGEYISGFVVSLYDLPDQTKNSNIIISNEGFHWQPPYAMGTIMFSYLNRSEKESYERFALRNLERAIRNVYGSIRPGGIAVLQFGHQGQVKKLWERIYEIFHEDTFNGYVRKVNFLVFHPTVENISNAILSAGFLNANTEINSYSQDLPDKSPLAITEYFKAFSQPGLSQYLPSVILHQFYERLKSRLNTLNMVEFRKDLLRRTLITLKK